MIIHKRLRLTRLALALSAALAVTQPALAQNTTSALSGRAYTAQGAPAANATVRIIHVESGSASEVKADAEGRYAARGLRPGGPYTVVITQNGQSQTKENVFLTLAETTNLDLSLAGEMAVVSIRGRALSQVFRDDAMGATTNVGPQELRNLSSISRSLSDYARLDPRLTQTDKERGELSVGGQNSRYNSITVDGLSISDTFGLEGNGLPTNKQPISLDAIQSVQVNVSNYDVTQRGYLGANINAVTKSGTNDIKGSAYVVYRDERMVGKRVNTTDGKYSKVAPFQEKLGGFTLGAPLIKDKLFIFVSAENSTSSRASPAFGPLGSSLTNAGITQSSIASLQNIAKSVYGIDVGSGDPPSGLELTVKERLVKLDWNINDDHRASLRWQKTDQSEPQFSGYSASGIAMTSYLWAERKNFESMIGQWFADWSSTLSTEVKVSRRDSGKQHDNNAYLPTMTLRFGGPLPASAPNTVRSGNRFINFGTESSRQFNQLDTRTIDAYAGATWTRDDHEIKGGFDFTDNKFFNAFMQNVNGNYLFACQNSSASYTYDSIPGNASVNCSSSTAEVIEAAVLENFRRGRPTEYIAQLAFPGYSIQDATARWTLKNYGLFLQDTWRVNKELSLTYGLRYDRAAVPEIPLRNPVVDAAPVAGVYNTNPALIRRQTGGFGLSNQVTIDGADVVQPRLGFNWRPAAPRMTQVRGGAGLFSGSALNVWLGNPFQNTGIVVYTTSCGTSGFAACTSAPLFVADPTRQPIVQTSTPAANVDFLQAGIKQPAVWKANLAVEHELPWYGMVLSAEYLYSNTHKGIFYQHLNLGDPTRLGPDGRQLFWTETGYTAACANGTGNFLTTGACTGHRARALSNGAFNNAIVARNTDKGSASVATLTLSSGAARDLRWFVSYTLSSAKEVSPLSSSTSGSGFGSRPIFNPNEEVEASSQYLVKNRFGAMLSWEKRFFGNYRTTLGAFYEGRNGKPYSWTFNNDMNGDGVSANDLMYIPSAFGSGEVIFRGDTADNRANEQRFWDVVNGDKTLTAARGGVVRRGANMSPWVNSVDLRVSQEVPGLWKNHKGALVIDFQNVGNMINKRWGRIDEITFASAGGNTRNFVDYAGMQDGKYVYQVRDQIENYSVKQTAGESQWAVQVTLRYEF